VFKISLQFTALQKADRDSIHVMLKILSSLAREFNISRINVMQQLEREYDVEIRRDFNGDVSGFSVATDEEMDWLDEFTKFLNSSQSAQSDRVALVKTGTGSD